MREWTYGFWPDVDGFEENAASPVPGKESLRENNLHRGKLAPLIGGWYGILTRETMSESADAFLFDTPYAHSSELYSEPDEGFVEGPDLPTARVYGFDVTDAEEEVIYQKCEHHYAFPPHYSITEGSYCTALVAEDCIETGVLDPGLRKPKQRPEQFRAKLDELVLSTQATHRVFALGFEIIEGVRSRTWLEKETE